MAILVVVVDEPADRGGQVTDGFEGAAALPSFATYSTSAPTVAIVPKLDLCQVVPGNSVASACKSSFVDPFNLFFGWLSADPSVASAQVAALAAVISGVIGLAIGVATVLVARQSIEATQREFSRQVGRSAIDARRNFYEDAMRVAVAADTVLASNHQAVVDVGRAISDVNLRSTLLDLPKDVVDDLLSLMWVSEACLNETDRLERDDYHGAFQKALRAFGLSGSQELALSERTLKPSAPTRRSRRQVTSGAPSGSESGRFVAQAEMLGAARHDRDEALRDLRARYPRFPPEKPRLHDLGPPP